MADIDKEILDQLFPAPSLEELKEATVQDLAQEGFSITNFHPGGVFHGLLMILLKIKMEFTELLRSMLGSMTVSYSSGIWLDLAASNYSKTRKQSRKALGIVTVSRAAAGDAVQIAKGHVFKTALDINGDELRYFATETVTLVKDALTASVPVEAEIEGSRYNVPAGQITRSLIHIGSGVNTITNRENWLTREGSDTETDEELRTRTLRSWAELARVPIHDTYVNICEAVPGVLYATVDDQHPRGQGSIDVIVTSTAGAASAALLSAVQVACNSIKAPDDHVLVKSAAVVPQVISLTVTVPSTMSVDGLVSRVNNSVLELMKIQRGRKLNELLLVDISHKIKSDVPAIRNVVITTPASDISLAADKVIVPGEITVSVQGV